MFLQNAQQIIFLDNGKLGGVGSFQSLVQNSKHKFLEKLKSESEVEDDKQRLLFLGRY